MRNQADIFLCSKCGEKLVRQSHKMVCSSCGREEGYVQDEVVVFHDTQGKQGFFEMQTADRIGKLYSDYSYEKFKASLQAVDFDEMDLLNKKVGITRKKWWEKHIGSIRDATILEIGCGINYLVPYWLDCGNRVVAFDICKESVFLLNDVLKKTGINTDNLTLFVGDAERVRLFEKFDIININNVLHHIADKRKVLAKAGECLRDNGKILLVEPNYYYPPRWIIETDFMERVNFVKAYFMKKDLMEKNEKGVVFKELKKMIRETGFRIEWNGKDLNFLGYFCYILHHSKFISRTLFLIDQYFLGRLLPSVLAPFEYLILSKSLAETAS